jgi:hypothetical protein
MLRLPLPASFNQGSMFDPGFSYQFRYFSSMFFGVNFAEFNKMSQVLRMKHDHNRLSG